MPKKYTFYWHIHQPMTPVKNPEKIPPEFIKAWESLDKAWKAYDKARLVKEASDKALEAYHKADEALYKAWKAYEKAWKAYTSEIEKLHKEEHPDCHWTDSTIFSKKVD